MVELNLNWIFRKSIDFTRLEQVRNLYYSFLTALIYEWCCQIVALESTITEMLHLVQSVKNQFLPVYRLPTELLCFIFDLAYDPCEERTCDALSFSHVCRRWRSTSISYPPLWSDIRLGTRLARLSDLCVERSAVNPLSIMIQMPHRSPDYGSFLDEDRRYREFFDEFIRSFDALTSNGERIKSIDVSISWPEGAPLYTLEFPAPNLESFRCTLTDIIGHTEGFHLPPTVFNGVLPSLKTIAFHNIESLSFRQFTRLTSVNLSTEIELQYDIAMLLNFLDASPSMKSFTLSGYWIMAAITDDLPCVVMRDLTSLSLIRTTPHPILFHLELPSMINLEVRSSAEDLIQNSLDGFLPNDTSKLGFLKHLHRLSIRELDNSRMLEIEGTTNDEAGHSFRVLEHGALVDADESQFTITALRYACSISLVNLRVLVIDRGGGRPHSELGAIPRDLARSTYQSLPSLQKLVVIDWFWADILQPLVHLYGDVLCPKLEQITVLIHPNTYRAIFQMVDLIVTSRASSGLARLRVSALYVRPTQPSVHDLWNGLCAERNIASGPDHDTKAYLRDRGRAAST